MAFNPNSEGLDFVQGGGLHIALGATTVEQTGIKPGRTYQFVARGGAALVRWGASDASAADGGFDFTVGANNTVYARAPAGVTAVNVIEAEASSTATATLTIGEVDTI